MSAQDSSSDHASLTVSLEDHLARTLRPIVSLLPNALSAELQDVLDAPPDHPFRGRPGGGDAHEQPPVKTIPYSLLLAISKWSRSPEGAAALARHEPPLPPQDYTMVSLLAGTRTCPDRKYPAVPVPGTSDDARAAQRRELDDRRAITAVVNALLTIAGSGLAVYWAAGRLAWKEEWKVLLGLFVAITVAASEGILFLIWDSRRQKSKSTRPLRPPARTLPPNSHRPLAADKKSPEDAAADERPAPLDPRVITASSTDSPGTDHGALRERVRPQTEQNVGSRRNQ
ncbi:hypothetical protein FKP32DRAFT_314666 [Trametes sanguinea]|nr:hypothetical protein FKP32DRAFT_314666 [Trametes sanguinea]